MAFDRNDELLDETRSHAPDSGTVPGSPGKRSLTGGLAPSPGAVARQIMRLLRNEDRDSNGVAANADAAVTQASASTGAPLPDDVRARFEGSLGADLSTVRVHTGGDSIAATQAVGARAYTTGQDIHFNAGQYAPTDPFGLHLLAHEVAHTVQQSGGAPMPQCKLEVSAPGDAAEVEADRAADAMVAGRPAEVTSGTGFVRKVMRDALPNIARPTAPAAVDLGATFQMNARVTNPDPKKQYRWGWVDEEDKLQKTIPTTTAPMATLVAKPKSVGTSTIGARVSDDPAGGVFVESPSVAVKTPAVDSIWSTAVSPGGKGTKRSLAAEPPIIYTADSVTLGAQLTHVQDPTSAGIKTTIAATSSRTPPPMPNVMWIGNKAYWALGSLPVGDVTYDIDVIVPGMSEPLNYKTNFKVLMDRDAYKDSVKQARRTIRTGYSRADVWASQTTVNYVAAYQKFDGQLATANASEKLNNDILLGICFAVIGGAAGAAVAALSGVGAQVKSAVQKAAMTDGVKDLGKYLVRLGGAAAIPADPKKPGTVLADPVSFYPALRGVIEAEREAMNGLLDKMEDKADTADETLLDHDPNAIVTESMEAGVMVGTDPGPVGTTKAYFASLWKTWISNYAYVVRSVEQRHNNRGPMPSFRDEVQSNLTNSLTGAIRGAASECGESGDAWLALAGIAKQAAEEELRRRQQPTPEELERFRKHKERKGWIEGHRTEYEEHQERCERHADAHDRMPDIVAPVTCEDSAQKALERDAPPAP